MKELIAHPNLVFAFCLLCAGSTLLLLLFVQFSRNTRLSTACIY